jgi:hypothetical protein
VREERKEREGGREGEKERQEEELEADWSSWSHFCGGTVVGVDKRKGGSWRGNVREKRARREKEERFV